MRKTTEASMAIGRSRTYSWAELRNLSEEEKYALDIYHRVDSALCWRNLTGLYGTVAREQNALIARCVEGSNVLDVGSGFGLLSRQLLDGGFDVVSLEPCQESRALSAEWYGVHAVDGDIHSSGFPDKSFDTVILREVVEHLDVTRALSEACRLARSAVVVFQRSTLNLFLRVSRHLVRHRELHAVPVGNLQAILRSCGFSRQEVWYSDVLAFPLSGGYLRPQLVPRWGGAYSAVLSVDRGLARGLHLLRLERFFCWRYVLTARP